MIVSGVCVSVCLCKNFAGVDHCYMKGHTEENIEHGEDVWGWNLIPSEYQALLLTTHIRLV
jgi:hypothetical protein